MRKEYVKPVFNTVDLKIEERLASCETGYEGLHSFPGCNPYDTQEEQGS